MNLLKSALLIASLLILFSCGSTEESTDARQTLENDDMKISYQIEEFEGKLTLSGKISIKEANSSPLALNVIEEGQQNGTVTNKEGEFKLQLKSEKSTISISFGELNPLKIDLDK
jgi:hypothetical protein